MAEPEIELARKLSEVGSMILNPPSDVHKLLPILDQAEVLLSKVDQSPALPLWNALCPAVKGLVASELLRNPDVYVKVTVASCINEIIRITAPEAPYDNMLMKEIFEMSVEALKGLNNVDSQLYRKRVSILQTLALVRSSVIMLDLECEELIIQMFSLFFHTISERNAERVMPLMEIIMTDILEESEDIAVGIISCILDSVKLNNRGMPQKLGKNLIRNCAVKLKPRLLETISHRGADISGYCKIIRVIYQNELCTSKDVDLNASGLDDDNKLSDGTISEDLQLGDDSKLPDRSISELQPGSASICIEFTSTEEYDMAVKKDASFRESTVLTDSEFKPLSNPTSPMNSVSLHPDILRGSSTSAEENLDNANLSPPRIICSSSKNFEESAVQMHTILEQSSRKDSLGICRCDHELSCLVKGCNELESGHSSDKLDMNILLKEGSYSEQQVLKEDFDAMLIPILGAASADEACPGSGHGLSNVFTSPIQNCDDGPAELHMPSGCNKVPLISDEVLVPGSTKTDIGHMAAIPNSCSHRTVTNTGLTNQASACCISDSNGNGILFGPTSMEVKLMESVGEGHLKNIHDVEARSHNSALAKMLTNETEIKCGGKAEVLREVQVFKRRLHKSKASTLEDMGTEQIHTVVSSLKKRTESKICNTQHHSKEIMSELNMHTYNLEEMNDQVDKTEPSENGFEPKLHGGRMTTHEDSQGEQTLFGSKELVGVAVGSKIEVWWPEDKKFYPAVVESFNPDSKRHKVVYADGDVEDLVLSNERWMFKRGHDLNGSKEFGEQVVAVGSKIDVWWPDDKKFYPAFVGSFDPDSMTHKVLYLDGDVENLVLSNEQWKFRRDQDLNLQDTGTRTPVVAAGDLKRKKHKLEFEKKIKNNDVPKSGTTKVAKPKIDIFTKDAAVDNIKLEKHMSWKAQCILKEGSRMILKFQKGGESKETKTKVSSMSTKGFEANKMNGKRRKKSGMQAEST